MIDNTHCPYCGKRIKATDDCVTRHGEFNFLWHIDCVRRMESPHPWEQFDDAAQRLIEAWKEAPPYTWVVRFAEWLALKVIA